MRFELDAEDFEEVHDGQLGSGDGPFTLRTSPVLRFGARVCKALMNEPVIPMKLEFWFERKGEQIGPEVQMVFKRSEGPWLLSRGWLFVRQTWCSARAEELGYPPLRPDVIKCLCQEGEPVQTVFGLVTTKLLDYMSERKITLNRAREELGVPEGLVLQGLSDSSA